MYESEVAEQTVRHIVDDIGITQMQAPAVKDVAANLLDGLEDYANPDAAFKVEVGGRPGLCLRFSRRLEAEMLPHPIEGLHAYIHASCEGYLELSDFERWLEGCLSAHQVPFNKYK